MTYSTPIRLAELMAALSVATDMGTGQPLEFAQSACVLAMRLGEQLGLNDTQLREVYYQALLRYIGCNAETHLAAAIVGDELVLRREFAQIDNGKTPEIMGLMVRLIREAHSGDSTLQVARAVMQGFMMIGRLPASFADHCEVAQRLAERFGFSGSILVALGQLYERWDGKGMPHKLKGEQVALSVRVVSLAQDAVVFQRLGDVAAAVQMVRERRGSAYEPRIADTFCRQAAQLMAGLEREPTWDAVLALEPAEHTSLSETQFDAACEAFADFVDIKSPYTLGHSRGVAELAALAAQQPGWSALDAKDVWRAGLLHDIGRTGVSSGIWDKAGPLSEREWEKVRLHPYYTKRVLARPEELARLGAIAALHHERLDGSGYHRALPAALLPPAARILAAADVYRAMGEARPHRPALAPAAAAAELLREAKAGRLDGDAVNSVLAAAGQRGDARRQVGDLPHVRADDLRPSAARRESPGGLTDREVDVLRLVARGNSNKEIARQLIVAPKTVDNHVQHIDAKLHVSTRAAATLFAVERHLLPEIDYPA